MDAPIGLFRAHITPLDRLVKTTVGRQDMLEDLLGKLARQAGKKGSQSYLFIGRRGIGKTHFLTLIEHAVKTKKNLQKTYTVLRFPEENNRILSFADLVLGMAELLAEGLDDKEWCELHLSTVGLEKDEEIIDTVVPKLRHYQKQTGKMLLVLVENLDILLTEQIKREQDIHHLRTFLMDSPCAVLIGTSPVYFPGLHDNKKPLYDFFDIQVLEDLTEEETLEVIRKNLEWEKREDVLKGFGALTPKIRALHMMTGGNPRLIMMLYELVVYDNLIDVKMQLQKLLDQISPFYQDRLKDLAPQERALLETLALMRSAPRTPANIARQLRKTPQQISSLLKRMAGAGYLTASDNPLDRRSRIYRIKEGFFDLWLAMSESRAYRRKLGFLVEFFEVYYRDAEERERKRAELWHGIETFGAEKAKQENLYEVLDYLSDVGDAGERCQTKLELAIHKIKEGDPGEVDRLLGEIKEIAPGTPAFQWMAEQTGRWAKGDLDINVRKWLDELIEYWRTQRSGNLEAAVEIADRLGRDMSGRGLHKVRIELLADALKGVPEEGRKVKLLSDIAQSQKMDGQLEGALTSLEGALSIVRRTGDLAGEGAVLNNISQIYRVRGDYATALDYLRKSLEIQKEIGDRAGESVTLNNIGQIYRVRGDYATALDYLRKSLEITREIGDRAGEGATLNNIGQINHARGDYATALDYLQKSLEIRRQIGDQAGLGATLNNISGIYHDRGDYATALDYLQKSLEIMREIGDRAGEGATLNNISQIYRVQGDYATALDYLQKSLEIMREIGDRAGEGATLNNISQIYRVRGDYATALDYLQKSLEIARKIGDKAGMIPALHNMAHIYLQTEHLNEALDTFTEALQLARETGNAEGILNVSRDLGVLLCRAGQKEAGILLLRQAVEVGKAMGDPGSAEVEKMIKEYE
jgi:tetratricopeptide (TPR) repeat protein